MANLLLQGFSLPKNSLPGWSEILKPDHSICFRDIELVLKKFLGISPVIYQKDYLK